MRRDHFCFQTDAISGSLRGHDIFEITERRPLLARRGRRKKRAGTLLILLPSQKFFKQRFALGLSQHGGDTSRRMPLADTPLTFANAIVPLPRFCHAPFKPATPRP